MSRTPFDLWWQQRFPHRVSDGIYVVSTGSGMKLVTVQREWACEAPDCLDPILPGERALADDYRGDIRHWRWHVPCAQRHEQIVIVVDGFVEPHEEPEPPDVLCS